ncbi:MAG: hypothetical protein FJZ05_00705, partial [Candidatus Nealsonbacteria bacterium]|nr:hypothetical protein [Candidatus Nealsonbacteria bacterium]
MSSRNLKLITKTLLLSVIAITPFVKISSLYFPFVSGKVYIFRTLVMLALFFWVWLFLKEKEHVPDFKNILVIALILFFLAQVLVSFFGVNPLFSFFSDIQRSDGVLQYGFWILYFLLLISVFKEERDWRELFFVFIIVSFLLAIFAWFNYSPGQELFGNLFGNPAYFAGFLIFSIGFSLLAFERKFFYPRLIHYALLGTAGFFAITLIVTQIRGAFVGLAGGIFLFCLLSILFLRKENKKLAYSAGIILLLGLTSVIFLFSVREIEIVKSNYYLSRITEIADFQKAGSARERFLVWHVALEAFQEKPIFGWGPENFAPAFNKYYDHWAGEKETWFDKAHNIPLDILATGGIFLFSFYIVLLSAVIFLIFKMTKRQKILSFILASIFFAYFLQGLFFFDTFATSLGLFLFLAFLFFASRQLQIDTAGNKDLRRLDQSKSILIIGAFAIFSLFVIYTTVIMPWRANALALKFYLFTEAGFYQEAKPFLEKSFAIKSPYTYWEVRKEAGWQFLSVLEDKVDDKTVSQDIQAIESIYDFMVPELERFIENNPYEPQMYYVLARIYRAGFEKLGRDDLPKAEIVLEKALNYSDLRKEYFEELNQVLLLQGKFEEAEKLLQDYLKKVDFYDYFPYLTLGHFYFETEKDEQAMEQYEKAREAGYNFCKIEAEYSRYMTVAEYTREYQKIIDMAQKHMEEKGPDADTYFNIAVGYLNLEEKEKAE